MQAGIYDAFVEKLAAASAKLKVGSGLDEGTQQGPLIDEKAVAKVEEFVADAEAKGGKVVTGGQRHALGGSFFEPTVIADANARHDVHEGRDLRPDRPGVQVRDRGGGDRGWPTTPNSASPPISTPAISAAPSASWKALKYGMVGVNEGLITTPEAPFGGVKESGLGREGGHQGIEDYLDTKYVCIGGLGL